jgi:two-component system C4-dicarboxylate transport sensor histidine kinase DctB
MESGYSSPQEFDMATIPDSISTPPSADGWRARALEILRRSTLFWSVVAGACCIVTASVYYWASAAHFATLQQVATQRLEFFSTTLESALEKYEYLPFMLSLERDVGSLLRTGDARLAEEVNAYLLVLQQQSHVAAIYVLDVRGDTVAASNYREPSSFIGQNYAFRPYFRDAMAERTGRFYAVGATTGEPGYFLSHAVLVNRQPLGVVVVKVSLDELEQSWAKSGEALAVADDNGVVFLSTVASWKFHTLAPLDPAALERVRATRQYDPYPLAPIPARAPIVADADPAVAAVAGVATNSAAMHDMLVQNRPAGRLHWRVLLFSDLRETREAARNTAAAIGFALAFAMMLVFYYRQDKRRHEERIAARAALQRAHRELEQRIGERTAELLAANDELQRKVGELKQTEQMLRDTQDEVIQAGKLAVLGQMSAGITHELNQPLTALRTLSDNAVTLIDRGQFDAARENLGVIAQVCERAGKIVGQLKAFARKTQPTLTPVSVHEALTHALTLVEARCRQGGVTVGQDMPEGDLRVLGDEVRLEQVLVNLLRNALDALDQAGEKRLIVRVRRVGRQVEIAVRDSGPGIAVESLPRLFEPFYTTKPAGEGLGLGLAISQAIVHAMGGELTAENAPTGGAIFRAILPVAEDAAHE